MNSSSTNNSEIRKFGGIALVFFGFLFGLGFFTSKPVPACIFGFLSILGLGFILIPSPLRPIYTAWLKIAHVIVRTITALTLALAYYMVITPSAIIKRLIGGRPLPLRPNKKMTSYWITRSEPAQSKERFLKRY